MERYAKVVRTGERIRFEDYAADLKRWFSVLCWRIEGTENRRAAILATDITERKKAEEDLRIAHSRLQTLFDHRIVGIGIAISNAAGNVIHANDHLLKIFGCTREELISGKVDWRSLTPPEWQAADDYALQQLKNGGLYHAIEKEYVRRDGSRVPVLVTGVTMPGDSGEILSFILDIMERKKFEQSLKQLNMTLEQQVAERTKLAEGRAKQLQVLAMELIESEEQERRRISELLHDDLQQVLAATLMQLDSCSENLSAAAEIDLVRRLLKESISKARSLSHELSPTVLYHSGLVAGLRWLANQMNEKFGLNVQLDVHTDEKVDFSPTPIFIYRAVQELLFNVVKHSTVKNARVALSNTEKNIQNTVSDEGQGFNPDLLDSASTKAGLGLMSVRERANYFGGSLEINSSPGQGSRFTLILPITLQTGDQSIR
jgi:two-component system CheB/CheR fusion protein